MPTDGAAGPGGGEGTPPAGGTSERRGEGTPIEDGTTPVERFERKKKTCTRRSVYRKKKWDASPTENSNPGHAPLRAKKDAAVRSVERQNQQSQSPDDGRAVPDGDHPRSNRGGLSSQAEDKDTAAKQPSTGEYERALQVEYEGENRAA
jgi:hypothetical protein